MDVVSKTNQVRSVISPRVTQSVSGFQASRRFLVDD